MTIVEAPPRDSDLIAAISHGSVASFDVLYDRYAERAHRIAFSVCLDDGRAQEAVQEAFLAVWQTGASFSAQRGSVAGWLLSIVRHRAIDITRRHGRHAARRAGDERLLQQIPTVAPAGEVALRREADDELRDSLTRLPAAQQEVITLAFFGELSHTEIARALDLPPGTVKGRMRLGLDKLRALVEHP